MRLLVPILLLIALIAAALLMGGRDILHQRDLVTTYTPVWGTMLTNAQPQWVSQELYEVKVEYQYLIGGKNYIGRQLAPLSLAGDITWAKAMAEELPEGRNVKIYHNPQKPEESFLRPQTKFQPYLFILALAPGLAAFLKILKEGGFLSRRPQCFLNPADQWYVYRIESTLGRSLTAAGLALLGWYGLGTAVGLHYYSVAQAPSHQLAIISLSIYGLAGLAIVAWTFRRLRLSLTYQDPQLSATLDRFHLGQPLIVRLTQPVNRAIDLRELRLALVCESREGWLTERQFMTSKQLVHGQRIEPNHSVILEHEFEITRRDVPASSPFSRWSYPRIDWYIEVLIEPVRGPRAKMRFPILLSVPKTR